VRLRTWAWLPHGKGIRVSIIVQINRGNEQLYWQDLRVAQLVRRYGQWESVERDFVLPANLEPTDVLRLQVWQFGAMRDNLYLDDISLEKIN
jgi:hypothetical protein